MFTTTSVKLIGRDGRNFALRPAVICRAAKRSIPMIGESSSSSMKHRKDTKEKSDERKRNRKKHNKPKFLRTCTVYVCRKEGEEQSGSDWTPTRYG